MLHVLNGPIQLPRCFRNSWILSLTGQLLKLTLEVLGFAQQIALCSRIGSATATLTGLCGALTSRSFLTLCEFFKLLRQLIHFLLGLLFLLPAGSLSALNRFVLILTGIQFECEKIGEILCTASPAAASAATSTAATLLNLDLGVKRGSVGKVL